jgi:RNA recognition motif-containing protein
MFAGRSIVSSVLRRAVVSTSSSRSFIVPALSLIKNAYQPKIVTSIASRSFMTSGILSVSDDAADSAPKPRMQPARNTDGSRASLFIGNLDFSITEQALLDMCEGVLGPNIATRARVAVDRESGTHSI